MFGFRRLVSAILVALAFCVTSSGALANDRYADESVYREYRAAKRQQVSDLCNIWFATWRPSTVGQTYIDLANRYASIDLSRCSPALRKHIMKAESATTEIGELFGQGTMPDIEVVLLSIKGGGGVSSSTTLTSARGRLILERMRELSESEAATVRELRLFE